jgi:hypothetical protein
MGLFKVKASRPENKDCEIVVDLDAIVEDTVSFKLHGKVHDIKPVLVKDFFKLANAMNVLLTLRQKEQLTTEEVMEGFHSLISSVCDTITREDI